MNRSHPNLILVNDTVRTVRTVRQRGFTGASGRTVASMKPSEDRPKQLLGTTGDGTLSHPCGNGRAVCLFLSMA